MCNVGKCHYCSRPARLVMQELVKGNKFHKVEDFVFRQYLCPWHLGAHNRWAKKMNFKIKLKYEDYKPDSYFGI